MYIKKRYMLDACCEGTFLGASCVNIFKRFKVLDLEKSVAIFRTLRGKCTKLKAIFLATTVVSSRQVASPSICISDLTVVKKKTKELQRM